MPTTESFAWLVFVRTADEGKSRRKYQDALALVRADAETVDAGITALTLRFKGDSFKPQFAFCDWRQMDAESKAWARLSLSDVTDKAARMEPWSSFRNACTALFGDRVDFTAAVLDGPAEQLPAAIAETVPVPILGVLWHNPNTPALALAVAFDRYWQTLDAATVPAGDDRRIPEDAGAVLLSEVTEALHNALAAEHNRLIMAHGREIDPPAEIQLWSSDYPDGRDATPIPWSAVKVRTMDVGRDGADARLMTAIDRAQKATACPVERHNAQNAIKPGGPHRRYFAGDVIRRDTLDALESVGKLLRLNDHPLAETVARLEAATSALPAIMESHTKGMERVAAAIESVGPRSDDRIVETKPAQPIPAIIADDAWMTHTDIADHHRVNREALRKRLERYRASNHNGWKEVDQRAPNEPKYLFHYGSVKAIALDLQASGETSGNRPAK